MSSVQKLINFIVTKNRFDFGCSQRLTRIVELNNFIVVGDFAQETPRVATGRSGAFEPKFYDCHIFEYSKCVGQPQVRKMFTQRRKGAKKIYFF